MGRDLGTYFIRWTLYDGRGVNTEINTGYRFALRCGSTSPLYASPITPVYESEEDLVETVVYLFQHGGWSCDCNRERDLARAYQQPEPEDEHGKEGLCKGGPKLVIKKLEILNPQLEVIYSKEPFENESTRKSNS